MQLIANEDELQEIKARKRGFLVNVWPGTVVVVHNLEHLCGQAQHQLGYSPNDPTYFAKTRQEINNRPYPWGQEELRDCSHCEQRRQK
jgi:hypothetical protein